MSAMAALATPQPMTPALAPAIACRGLRYAYKDGTTATDGVDLDIAAGELFCLLGANGAGKTTLIRQLTTELRPHAGSIRLLGCDLLAEPGWAKARMGILPQSAGLFAELTVAQHLACFAPLKAIPVHAQKAAIERIVADCRLTPLLPRRAGQLSLGQQRWVLVALALLGDPPLLILDEPTVGMDPTARRTLWRLLKDLRAGERTILLTTHYLDEAEHLADRIAFIKAGRIGTCGTLADLYATVGASVRVQVQDPATGAVVETRLFDTLAEAQAFVAARGLLSYSVGRITLEDIYLRLLGDQPEAA